MDTSFICSSVAQTLFEDLRGTARRATGDVPLSTFVSLMERNRDATADGTYAWRAGEDLPIYSLGIVGDVIAGAPTLGAALRSFVHGLPLVQSNTTLSLAVSDDMVRIGYRILDPDIWPRRADAELTLAVIHAICMKFGMPARALQEVGFEHAADGRTIAISRYICRNSACDERENYLVFPARFLSLARPAGGQAGDADFGRRRMALDSELADRLRQTPASDRVRQQILRRIGLRSFGQLEIASDLGMSERTLRRSLAAEATSYHSILEECRRAHAMALLTRSELPLSEVALSLGYSDQTAFSRAFSRWFAKPPKTVRSAVGPVC